MIITLFTIFSVRWAVLVIRKRLPTVVLKISDSGFNNILKELKVQYNPSVPFHDFSTHFIVKIGNLHLKFGQCYDVGNMANNLFIPPAE